MTALHDELHEETPLLQEQHLGNGSEIPEAFPIETNKGSVSTTRGFTIAGCLFFLVFFQSGNMSGLTTTQSEIAIELDAFDYVSWFASTYLIASASLSPVAGRLSQIFSPRSLLIVAAMIFSLGTFITSQAHTLSVFLIGRAITGIGSAGLLPLSIVLVLELTSKKRRGLFIGLLNTNWTIGVAMGAVVAGALLPLVGWRALFWAQTPITALAGLGLYFSTPKHLDSVASDDKLKEKLLKIDYLGAITMTATVSLFLLGLSSAKIIWQYLVISAGLLIVFLINEFFVAQDPIIPIQILKSRAMLFICLGQLGIMLSRWTVLFYSPTYAIASLGWSAGTAGSLLVATNSGFASGGLSIGHFHVRRTGSFWLPSIVAFSVFTLSLFCLSQATAPGVSPVFFIVITFINGFSTGAGLNYTLAHALHLTPTKTHFIVTSLMATFRNLAGSFGSAIGGGIFVRNLRAALVSGFAEKGITGREELIRKLLGSPALVHELYGDEKEVAIVSYATSLQKLFLAASGFAIIVIVIQASTGWKAAEPVEENDADTGTEETVEP